MQEFQFPNWVNKFTMLTLGGTFAVGGYLALCLYMAVHPSTVNVGHQPIQPIPFSHKTHAGKLKLDCRYCHNTVSKAAYAAIPPTAYCGNCHGGNRVKEGATLGIVQPDSELLKKVRDSLETQDPIEWIKVHDVPDFVYFNHSAHINRGVSCVECHGRVDKMEVVTQVKPLSMKWCLDCHRNPDAHLRDPALVTRLDFKPPDGQSAEEYGKTWREKLNVQPSTSCSICHR